MKKLILLFVFVTTGLLSNAQATHSQLDPASRAKRLTSTMTRVMDLTADEQTKVAPINLEKTTAIDANKTKSGAELETGRKTINDKWLADIEKVVPADKMAKLKKYVADKQAGKTDNEIE